MSFLEIPGFCANVMTLTPLFYAEVFQKYKKKQTILKEEYVCKAQNSQTWKYWNMCVPSMLKLWNLKFDISQL